MIFCDLIVDSSRRVWFASAGREGDVSVEELSVGEAASRITDAGSVVCADSRHLLDVGLEPAHVRGLLDVSLWLGDRRLAGRRRLPSETWSAFESAGRRLRAAVRTASHAGIDPNAHPLGALVPRWVPSAALREGVKVVRGLWLSGLARGDLPPRGAHLTDLAVAGLLFSAEQTGFAVDRTVASRWGSEEDPVCKRLLHRLSEVPRGIVFPRFDVHGGRTRRIGTSHGSFPVMGLPREGNVRRAIVSSWSGGHVASLDFNAQDQRCMVGAVPDRAFRDLYAGASDFHARTSEIVLGHAPRDPAERRIVKESFYVAAYGGTPDTVASKTGLSVTDASRIVEMTERALAPIVELRTATSREARESGRISMPDGTWVPADPGDHDGKLMALRFQTSSAISFRRALARFSTISGPGRFVFPVHDEVVLDLPPGQGSEVALGVYASELEEGARVPGLDVDFRVKVHVGENYGDMREVTR